MSRETNYLTKEKFEELKKELDEMRLVGRKEVAEELEYSKQLGDLSENAEYHQARERQAILEEKIARLDSLLKSSVIADSQNHNTDCVGVGTTVELSKDPKKESVTYTVVGSEEADMVNRKLSITSPLGVAMKGKKKGESFKLKTPAGEVKYTIVKIS